MGTGPRLIASILALSLAGCAGTWTSGRPIYPDGWPALAGGPECPDISGTYRAVSDEVGPLRYRSGEHPREMFFFVTYGAPQPLPPLGRRILTWHLAADFGEARDVLERYAALLDTTHPDLDRGWVRVTVRPDSALRIQAGRDVEAGLDFTLEKEPQGPGRYRSHVYACKDGGLTVRGAFPPPPVENPTGQRLDAAAKFTFFRAADGSLVALEEKYADVVEGNLAFDKWWRWRRIDAR